METDWDKKSIKELQQLLQEGRYIDNMGLITRISSVLMSRSMGELGSIIEGVGQTTVNNLYALNNGIKEMNNGIGKMITK